MSLLLEDPSKRRIVVAIVGEPNWYPRDWAECRFMGRVIADIAKAIHGDAWFGDEPFTRLPDVLPDAVPYQTNVLMAAMDDGDRLALWYESPKRQVLERADSLLRLYRPELSRGPSLIGMTQAPNQPISFTMREWRAAQELARREHEEARAGIARWQDVQIRMLDFCEAGILRAKLLPVDGGEFSEVLPPSAWRTRSYQSRFSTFRMHPHSHPTGRTVLDSMDWIYFTKDSLKAALAMIEAEKTPEARPTDELAPYESEYMAHMRLVIDKLGITRENQLTVESIKASVAELWQGSEPLSVIEVGKLASFIRLRESKGGRNKKARK